MTKKSTRADAGQGTIEYVGVVLLLLGVIVGVSALVQGKPRLVVLTILLTVFAAVTSYEVVADFRARRARRRQRAELGAASQVASLLDATVQRMIELREEVTRLEADAVDKQKASKHAGELAAMNEEQAEALVHRLQIEFRSNEARNLWFGFALNASFFLLGVVTSQLLK